MYEVLIEGLAETLGALGRYDEIAEQELYRAMLDGIKAICESARELAPVWRGDLASSMQSRVSAIGSLLVGEVYSDAPNPIYPLVMEYGRRAGARPPPSTAIADWVEDKLGDRGLAFVVARSIGRKGIKGYFFLKRAFLAQAVYVLGSFKVACDRIADRLAARP